MELLNCTGTKYKDTCDVSCDKEFNQTISYVQCGSDGYWTSHIGGKVVTVSIWKKNLLGNIFLMCLVRTWEF